MNTTMPFLRRRPKRKVGVTMASLATCAVLTACGGSADGDAAGDDGEATSVGYSAPFLTAQFEVVLQDQVLAEAEGSGLEFMSPTNADSDSGKQITDIANLISGGAEGLIVVANDSKAIIPGLDQANAADVPVVSIDIGPDGGSVAAIVRADNVGIGEQACEAMAEGIGEQGKVLSLMGASTSINGRERSEGFRTCMEGYPDIELIERPTDWDPTKQANALQTVLTANPDLAGIFQQSDYALSPTLAVLEQAGRDAKVGEEGHIFNVSVDGTAQALDLIRDGVLDAAVSQPLDGYAIYGVEYLQMALAGEELEVGPTDHDSEIVEFNGNLMDLLPAVLVTQENVEDESLWGNQGEQ